MYCRRNGGRLSLRLSALLISACITACGKIGPPRAPLTFVPAQTKDFSVQQLGNQLLLTMSYPTTTTSGLALEGIEGLRIYLMSQSLAPPEELEDETKPDDIAEADDDLEGEPDVVEDADDTEEVSPPVQPSAAEEFIGSWVLRGDFSGSLYIRNDGGNAVATVGLGQFGDSDVEDIVESAQGIELRFEADDGVGRRSVVMTLERYGDGIVGDIRDNSGAIDLEFSGLEIVRSEPSDPRLGGRAFAAGNELLITIEAAELHSFTSGNRIAVRLPLPPESLEEETLLAFAVRSQTSKGKVSPMSNIAILVPRSPIDGPLTIDVTGTAAGIEVRWSTDALDLEGFSVYRRFAEDRLFGEPLATVGVAERSYLDPTALYDTRYIYSVRSVVSSQPLIESGVASEIELDYQDRFPPAPPTRLDSLPEEGRIRLLWTASEDADVAGYFVYRQEPGREFQRLSTEPTTRSEYLDETTVSGRDYGYYVTAIDLHGNESEPGVEISERAR